MEKWFINDVRRVIEKYQMIEDGEKSGSGSFGR